MALTCARCGTQNPDGNQFCQACGTPLAVAPAQPAPGANPFPPPPGSALPGPPQVPPAPGGYQSPYYAPSAVGPQPPVHRTPWMLIISAIVVLVLLMAGCGTAIAVLSNRGGGPGGSAGILPSPSPAGTPTPTTAPTAGGPTASNNGLTISLPRGWTVVNKDNESITITNPNGDGSLTVGSGASSPSQTAQQNKDTIDKFFQGKYPDTKSCPGSKATAGSLNGRSGISWALCFTLSSGSQSIPADASLFVGANSNGSVYYLAFLLTSRSNIKNFTAEAGPILKSIQWKLS
jgi:hypothetical protein